MKLGIFVLLMFAYFKSLQTKKLYGMDFGKNRYSQNTHDGCPEDAMRCDDKCIYASDHWTKPCLVSDKNWAPCVEFQYPFYCPALKTCLSVLDQCEGKCAEQEAYINPYSDYPESYKCGDKCANIHVPCNGSCAHPPEIKKYDYYDYDYACGEMCVGKPTAKNAKICDGKCVKASVTCNGVEEKIEGIEEKKEEEEQKQQKFCYGMIDCKTCEPGNIACKEESPAYGKQCIHESYVCDGNNNCGDGSDEENCDCINMANNCTSCAPGLGENAYQCKNEKKCIRESLMCNGDPDCDGGDDENCTDDNGNYCKYQSYNKGGMRRCNGKWLCNTEVCYEDDDEPCKWPWFECNSKCNREDETCDGKCKDDGYEVMHLCNGKCLKKNEQCNGVCPITNFKVACTNSTQCIRSWDACDKDVDCENGSDEWGENCKCPGMWNCEICIKEKESFACKDNSQCLRYPKLCNGIQDCADNSDENDCEVDGECPGRFYCNTAPVNRLSTGTWICKNEVCHNGEISYGEFGDYCHQDQQICGQKCISKDSPCDGKCLDSHGNEAGDREYCSATNKCITHKEQCDGECLKKGWYGYVPCGDECVEEKRNKYWTCNGLCISETTPCNGTCEPNSNKCGDECRKSYDSVWDCNGECIDEKRSCNGECKPEGYYKIACGEHCIHDEDDGRNCGGECIKATELQETYKGNSKWNPTCGNECNFGFKCKDGSTCLEFGYECDGVKDCPDGSDEEAAFCKECHKYEWGKCYSKQGTKNNYHCLTENCPCSDYENYFGCGDRCNLKSEFCQETASCFSDDFHCGDDTCIKNNLRCNGASDCKSGLDEEGCPDCSERHGVWQCGKTMQCRDTPCV